MAAAPLGGGDSGTDAAVGSLPVFLIDCARPTPAGIAYPGADEVAMSLPALAEQHALAPLFWRQLTRLPAADLPAGLGERAIAELAGIRAAAGGIAREAVRVVTALDRARIASLLLKGPALAALAWDDPLLRASRDLDLLVAEADVPAARAVLAELGYGATARPYAGARADHLVAAASGMVVDLHWNLLGAHLPLPVDVAALLADAVPVALPGGTVRTPDLAWQLVLAALYLAKDLPRLDLGRLADLAALAARADAPLLARARSHAAAWRLATTFDAALAVTALVLGVNALPAAAQPAPTPRLTGLAARLGRRLGAAEPRGLPVQLDWLRRLGWQMALRDAPADRLRILFGLPALTFGPSAEDARLAAAMGGRVPAALLRPPRLAAAITAQLARGLGAALRARGQRLRRRLIATGRLPARPSAEVALCVVGAEGLLFDPRSQLVWGLNATAAFLWCCLEDGLDRPAAIAAYGEAFDLPPAAARAAVGGLLGRFWDMGVLAAAPQPAAGNAIPPAPAVARPTAAPPAAGPAVTLELLGRGWTIRCPDRATAALVAPALGCGRIVAGLSPADLEIRRDATGYWLVVAGTELDGCDDAAEIAPLLRGELVARAVNATDFALDLHAALLRWGDAALLLPAAPGSGKTMLTEALVRSGFGFGTDEVTLLDGTLAARALPLALGFKESAWPLVTGLRPELAAAPSHRRADGRLVRYLPLPADAPGPLPVRWIVFPRYRPGAPTRLAQLGTVEALRRLLAECLALRRPLDRARFTQLATWIDAIPCHELMVGDSASAVAVLRALVQKPAEAAAVPAAAQLR